MSSCEKENLGLLKRRFPEVYHVIQGMEERDSLPLIPTPSGAFTFKGKTPDNRDLFVHSARDPRSEARRIKESLAGDHRMLVFLGCGLFYHILEIIREVPGSEPLLLIEKDLRHLHAALRSMPLAPVLERHGAVLFLDKRPDEIEQFVAAHFPPEVLASLRMVRLLPCMEMAPDYYRAVEEKMQWLSDLADCRIHDPEVAGIVKAYGGFSEMTRARVAADLGRFSLAESEASGILRLMEALSRE